MKWISPEDELPPQGKKILYFKKGDIYVVQRFDDMWVPIPFYDSKFAFHSKPDLWCNITPPERFTGKMHVATHNTMRKVDIDELEMLDQEAYMKLMKGIRSLWIHKTFKEDL